MVTSRAALMRWPPYVCALTFTAVPGTWVLGQPLVSGAVMFLACVLTIAIVAIVKSSICFIVKSSSFATEGIN